MTSVPTADDLLDAATRAFGTVEEGRDFLHRRHAELAMRRPIDLAGTADAQRVIAILHALEHGLAV